MERSVGPPPLEEGERAEAFVAPEEIVIDDDLLLRWLKPEEAPLLSKVVQENVDYIGEWESWAYKEDKVAAYYRIMRYRAQAQEGRSAPYGIFYDNELVGGVMLHRFEAGYARLGYWRADNENLRHKGIVRRAARAVVDMGLTDFHLEAVLLEVLPDNLPSRKVADALGATLCSHTDDGTFVYGITKVPGRGDA